MRSTNKALRTLLGAGLLAVLAVLAAGALSGRAHADALGDFSYFTTPKPVPPIAFEDGNGRPLTLAEFKGRVVLVNFWATWCGPCVKEMPSLDRLQARLGGPGFTVLDLSIDRQGKAAVEPFFAVNKLTHLKIYLDPKAAAFHAWHGEGVPMSYLIGRDGRALGMILGPADWDSPAMIAIVEHAVAEGAPGPKMKSTERATRRLAPLG